MYRQIMVPVDLAHAEMLEKALRTASDLARHYEIPVCYVGVTADAPGSVAHTPEEFAQKLDAFVRAEAKRHGHRASAKALVRNDPTSELDDALLAAVEEVGADLVVMSSHKPGFADRFWPANGGKVAAHSDATVMVVRDS